MNKIQKMLHAAYCMRIYIIYIYVVYDNTAESGAFLSSLMVVCVNFQNASHLRQDENLCALLLCVTNQNLPTPGCQDV